MLRKHWSRVLQVVLAIALIGGCGSDKGSGGLSEDSGVDRVSGDARDDLRADVGEDHSDVVAPNDQVDAEEYDIETEIEVPVGPEPRVSDNFTVRASVEQVQVWGAVPELALELVDADGAQLADGATDYNGSLMFREVIPGKGYSVRPVDEPDDYTGPFKIVSIEKSWPDVSLYEQQVIEPGNGYLIVRDGTPLSYFASLPGPVEDGPYPTVVNYSGYSPGRPGVSLGGIVEAFCGMYPILCNAPDPPSTLILGLMGYASVNVNVRGTGCSGGAYDYFETLQSLDGYDVIEIVARQSWVKHNMVGMVGLSYPGNSQLFVASTQPPSLASISPMSIIPDTGLSTLMPGGILNDGFALDWIEGVLNKADPYAHGWIQEVVDSGDKLCEEHQLLHSQKVDVIEKAYANPYYTDDIAKPLAPMHFADKITVPVFLTGHCQDEQTGPHFPIIFDDFTNAPLTRFTMTNGVHPDGFSPQIITEWLNFNAFYVDRELPHVDIDVKTMVPVFMEQVYGAALEMPDGRFDEYTDFDEAIADYEDEQDIRVIFETGAHPDIDPGAPQGTFDAFFDLWPIPSVVAKRWYFQADGSLKTTLPSPDDEASSWEHDADAGQKLSLASGNVYVPQPNWDWQPPVEGKALSFITAPLTADMVFIGSGSVDLWLQSTADDADLEITLIEVRPDGMESYVQVGWLRASHRTLIDETTELQPVHSHYKKDVSPLTAGEWNEVRVEFMPVSHIFRAGSQVRVIIDTPGGSMARWQFNVLEYETIPTHTVAHSEAYPSSIVLPLIPDIEIPTEMPACNALRGQPCREYLPFTNRQADP